MLQEILIIGAGEPYNFKDDQTGRQISGRTVHYILRECPESAPRAGFTPSSEALSIESAASIKDIPGIYNGTFKLRSVKGKATLKLDEVEFISAVDL